jgi:pSer/pThr/pTyr-binding forkhead associated (FHA) protein
MNSLAVLVLQYAFLVLLWVFVYLAARTVVTDVYGARARGKARGGSAGVSTAAPLAARELVVTRGNLAGTKIPLGNQPITIGRSPGSTLTLADDFASGHHARVYPREGQWVIEDLGSTNGTYVSRTRVTAPTALPIGTPVTIGKTVFELRA